MLQIDASQAGQTVQIAVGEAVELRLAENLTTGSPLDRATGRRTRVPYHRRWI